MVLNIIVFSYIIPNPVISLPFFSYDVTLLILLLGEIGVVLSVSRKNNQRVEVSE